MRRQMVAFSFVLHATRLTCCNVRGWLRHRHWHQKTRIHRTPKTPRHPRRSALHFARLWSSPWMGDHKHDNNHNPNKTTHCTDEDVGLSVIRSYLSVYVIIMMICMCVHRWCECIAAIHHLHHRWARSNVDRLVCGFTGWPMINWRRSLKLIYRLKLWWMPTGIRAERICWKKLKTCDMQIFLTTFNFRLLFLNLNLWK